MGPTMQLTQWSPNGKGTLIALRSSPVRRVADRPFSSWESKGETLGQQIYAGYVGNPRNTDWAWMETTVFLFHDESGKSVGRMPLKAGDDARALKWIDISSDINLYASHKEFIKKAAHILKAHW